LNSIKVKRIPCEIESTGKKSSRIPLRLEIVEKPSEHFSAKALSLAKVPRSEASPEGAKIDKKKAPRLCASA
jgi:hypothetical protein